VNHLVVEQSFAHSKAFGYHLGIAVGL
jgi:hypothetical protein